MPLYAYKCNSCQRHLEIRQRFSDEPLSECPHCDGNLRRVISPVGVVFKGSGFYVTDNRNGKSNGSARPQTSESASDTKEKEKPKASTESKPKSDSSPAASAGAGA